MREIFLKIQIKNIYLIVINVVIHFKVMLMTFHEVDGVHIVITKNYVITKIAMNVLKNPLQVMKKQKIGQNKMKGNQGIFSKIAMINIGLIVINVNIFLINL